MKTMMINGETFEIHKSKHAHKFISEWLKHFVKHPCSSLDDFYGKYSATKKVVHEHWMN